MKEFEDLVSELSDWWNSGQGTTCEFSSDYTDINTKMEILARYSEGLRDGNWCVHHRNTCRCHNENKPLHVMIWRTI